MEKELFKFWYEKGVVDKYLKKNNNSNKRFRFLDGPITANNPMGVHHAWGRTYKDLWQRFYNLLGYKQRFQNGFDCQGLWVEVEVEKELGLKNKKEIEKLVPNDKKASIDKFVGLCKARVKKYSGIQTQQSKRLGYFMDWDNSYFTMSDDNNYMIWHFLKQCHKHGWIYKGRDVVPWCPRCQTAISQHEMLTEDYKEVVHKSVYMMFPLRGKEESLLVWTTTPWTIPANVAVVVDKSIKYSLVEVEGVKIWLAEDAVKRVLSNYEYKVIKTVKGAKLVGLEYTAPFDNLDLVKRMIDEYKGVVHRVYATDDKILPISVEEGTGIVHMATGAGEEDFKIGKNYKLPVLEVIDDEAYYLKGLDFLTGKNAKKHPEIILDYLSENKKFLFKIEKYRHRYPACWRCKTELVWKVADEWYIAMDKKSKLDGKKDPRTLRERMIDVAKKITWMPKFGLDREIDWLKNMHDWLISKKNRYWGLSLPIYECKKCGTFEVIGSKEELKERAVEGWSQFNGHSPHKPWIDDVKIKCNKCGGVMKRVNDVGNPWLDAGIVSFSTLKDPETKKLSYLENKKYFKEWFPFDFITESFPGQFKNWFYALIAMSTVLEKTNPFKTVLGFGTLLDETGRPMHKSWGNAIEFEEGADKIGVDVMRWMYSKQNPSDNMLFGYKKADEVRRQFYLILWNSYKYFIDYVLLDEMGEYVAGLDYRKNPDATNVLDLWILSYFYKTVKSVESSLKKFDTRSATKELEGFVSNLSTWYIRRSRNRLWVNSKNKKDKQSFYGIMYYVLVNLSIVLSPFLPFITDEMYRNMTGNLSVHLEQWPKVGDINETLIFKMDKVKEIVEVGRRIRKELKIKMRQPLSSAKVSLTKSDSNLVNKLDEFLELIKGELNIKNLELVLSDKSSDIDVKYDVKVTEELKKEGELRDLLRKIQFERKKMGLNPKDAIVLFVPSKFKDFSDEIKRKVLAKEIIFGQDFRVDKVN